MTCFTYDTDVQGRFTTLTVEGLEDEMFDSSDSNREYVEFHVFNETSFYRDDLETYEISNDGRRVIMTFINDKWN